MDGKIFERQITPTPISEFAFDLQRFADDTVVVENFEGLKSAIANTANAGKTIQLKSGGTFTGSETLTIDQNLTLDLNGQTLTTSAEIGVQVKNGVTFELKDSTAGTDGTSANGKIESTYTLKSGEDVKTSLRQKDDHAVIMVGEGVNQTNAQFKMTSGQITSDNLIGVDVLGESTFNMNGGYVHSTNSLAVYFGTFGDGYKSSDTGKYGTGGGGTFNMTDGKLESNATDTNLSTIQVSGNHVKSTTINISGGKVIYATGNASTTNTGKSRGAIFGSGVCNITISGTAEIESSHIGIEMAAGTLNVQGGTIQSKSTNGIQYESSANASFREGVAIAVGQHITKKNVTVNISGGNISGYSALTVANPKNNGAFGSTASGSDSSGNHNGEPKTGTTGYRESDDNKYQIGTVTVNVTGGTLESTASETTDTSELTSNTYTVKGKNAIVNLDKRVTIDMTGSATVNGALATNTDRTTGNGYNVTGTGNVFSNFNYTEGQNLVSYYQAQTTGTGAVNVAIVGVGKGWSWNAVNDNKWSYLVAGTNATSITSSDVIANLSGSGDVLTLNKGDKTVTSSTPIKLNFNEAPFDNLVSTYTKFTAQSVTDSLFGFDITANNHITSIVGGSGADTLTAGTNGTILDGGEGADSLVGGAGNDTFVVNGSDIIANYAAGDTIKFTSAPTITAEGNNVTFTLADATVVAQGAADKTLSVKVGTAAATDYAPVAQIGSTIYYTLADAVAVGGSIKLLASVVETITVSKETTIDLNGFKITGNITAAADLTLSDSGTSGTVSGTITKTEGGTLKITGGIYTDDISSYLNDVEYQVLGGKTRVGSSMVTVTPYMIYIDGNENYYATETALAAAKSATGNVASIGDDKYFTSLNKALTAAAETGDTIKLLQNVTETVNISKEVTLDLNGKTLTGNSSYAISVVAGGNLTILDSGTGGKVTAAESAVRVTGGTFELKSGTLTATANSANVVDLTATSTAESDNASFTMSGGEIQSSATASGSNVPAGVYVGKNRFFKMNGGTINTGGLGIASKGKQVDIAGGFIKGRTGIKMLMGALNVLGGKIRGLAGASGASNVAEDGSVTPALTSDEGFGEITEGNGIEIASTDEKVTVNVGKENTNADIDIGGTNAALEIGGSAETEINLYESKLASVTEDDGTAGTGSSINYGNGLAQLTVNGTILESAFTVTEGVTADVGTDESNKIKITSVAINSTAKFASTVLDSLTFNTNTEDLDGNTYNVVGTGNSNPITKNTVAKINGANYSSLNEAISKADANSTISLEKSQSISEQISVSKGMSFTFGEHTLTYNGSGNAALVVTSGTVSLDSASKFVNADNKALGIAIANNANVYVKNTDSTPATGNVVETDGVVEPADAPDGYTDYKETAKARIVTNDGEPPVYFSTVADAMEQLDTVGETVVVKVEGTELTYPTEGTKLKITGLETSTEVSISGEKNVSLKGANFGSGGVTVNSNADGYKFDLSGTVSGSGKALFTGTSNADTITNAIASLTISGSGGEDSIVNSGAGASIVGGDDKDTISNTGKNVTIDGGAGDDSINNNASNVTISAGEGADEIYSTGDNVSIDGGNGKDTLYYMGGKTTFKYDKDDAVNLGSGTLTPITDGSLLTSLTGEAGFVLKFSNANVLTLQGTDSIAVRPQSSTTDYVYTSTTISLTSENGVTLGADATAFDASSTTSINALAATSGVSILGANTDNFVTLGSGDDTYVYKAGSDEITGYGKGDIISLSSGTAPTTFDTTATAYASYDGSNYVFQLGGSSAISLKATSEITLASGNDSYYYNALKSIAKGEEAITLGPSYTSNFNGANTSYVTIDASEAAKALRITGNSGENYLVASSLFGGTLFGGDGADSLVAGSIGAVLNGQDGADSLIGGAGNDTFVYTGGVDSISGYETQDLVSVASGINVAGAVVSLTGENNADLILGFDTGNSLTFEGGKDSTISLKSGRRDYFFSANSIASGTSITLTANYTPADGEVFNSLGAYDTIDASLVGSAISITGNGNDNYIVGGTSGGSLFGSTGNDTLVGGKGADKFSYTAGKDVIVGFDGAADSLTIDETAIAKARESSRRLTFTMTDKNNTLVFRSDDSIPAKISLTDDGYLTKDGVVKGDDLKLFSSAKGRIDLNDTLYSAASIDAVDASTVKSQSVTLVGGTQGGAFTFATNGNKKRDGFEYGGGSATITNYESGKDRINLLNESIAGFSIVNSDDVMISLSSSDSNKFISLEGAQGDEILIHQSTNRGNSYSKMVFAQNGVVYDKAASKATSATIWAGGTGYSAENKIRKITVKDSLVSGISLGAGNNNTVIDASAANGVTLVSGAKNDRFIGSSKADTFIYTAGKDILQGFDASDSISLGNATLNTSEAKITANKKSIKFKFDGSKDVLTLKATKGDTLSGELNINGDTRTYGKNSIADSGNVTLTSKFGGTYNIDKSGGSTIDGHLVSKKLTFKGTDAAESLRGGSGKTMFKGGGGPNSGAAADTLVGGSGKDTFFYAKGDKGNVTIEDFDFTNDKLKIAGGTLAKVSTVGGGIQFAMKNGKGDSPEIGTFNITSSATYDKDNVKTATNTITANNTLIHVNNTYYWFATGDETVASEDDTLTAGALVTSVNKISSSQTKGYDIIELNYSTNLVRSNVAVQVKDALKPKS